ncbi:hypothetical protein GFS60_06459 (plasmid) [Rhodococcus sp. WAY2]|nr:hypothetical protein GFS60_06459 [Rhodococcus sp. WAY2]
MARRLWTSAAHPAPPPVQDHRPPQPGPGIRDDQWPNGGLLR